MSTSRHGRELDLEDLNRDFRFLRDDLRLKEAYIIALRTERAELERALRASERSLSWYSSR